MSDQPFLRASIDAEAAAETARQAHLASVLRGVQQSHAEASTRPGARDALIDQRVSEAGLPEPAQRAGEVADRIREAGLADRVRQRQRSQQS